MIDSLALSGCETMGWFGVFDVQPAFCHSCGGGEGMSQKILTFAAMMKLAGRRTHAVGYDGERGEVQEIGEAYSELRVPAARLLQRWWMPH